MAFSFRLDAETEAAIRRLAKATGRSKSAVVREAMSQYASGTPDTFSLPRTALERLTPFVGIVSTGAQLSTDAHAKFKAALTRKHRGRRSR